MIARPILYLDGTSTVSPLRPRLVPDAPIGDAIPTAALLASLSLALDLTEGQLPGHAVRTCYLAMRLADRLGVPEQVRTDVYFATYLKDAGCSSNAAALTRLFGADDIDLKRRRATIGRSLPAYAAFTIRSLASVPEPLPKRIRRLVTLALDGPEARREVEALRCERGASIARKAGFGDGVGEMVGGLHEHWDGGGEPRGIRGDAIPLGARIIAVCEALDAFRAMRGREAAVAVIRRRRGTWYEPTLVDELLAACAVGLLDDVEAPGMQGRTAALEPAGVVRMSSDEDVDRIAGAFADIVDAKSPYTGAHSHRVAGIAELLAERLGMSDEEQRDVRRAGLLHDLGKLGVPNRVLDKPGALDAGELEVIRRHPELTLRILAPIPTFSRVAQLAASHHERLDGTGYFRGLRAETLTLGARVVAVADVWEALTANRPYRQAMSHEQATEVIGRMAGDHLAADVVAALHDVLAADTAPRPQPQLFTPALGA